jgi:nicotinate phosphoribosyltransferase
MVTSRDQPALGGVYKLVDVDGSGRLKDSPGKETYPGAKQLFRREDHDCVGLAGEPPAGRPLLEPVLKAGALLGEPPPLETIRRRAREGLAALAPAVRRFEAPAPYRVEFSERLRAARRELLDRRNAR